MVYYIPSFAPLHIIDKLMDPMIIAKFIGHQWYFLRWQTLMEEIKECNKLWKMQNQCTLWSVVWNGCMSNRKRYHIRCIGGFCYQLYCKLVNPMGVWYHVFGILVWSWYKGVSKNSIPIQNWYQWITKNLISIRFIY